MSSKRARFPFLLAAVVLGLATMVIGAPVASAIPPPAGPPGQGLPKLEGQLKNGYNHLCMDDGYKNYEGHPVTFQRCKTVNGGYTAASQYFSLDDVYGGLMIHTLRSNICLARRLRGNPTPGDNLVTAKCSRRTSNEVFHYVGGSHGVPYYFYAHNTSYHSTKYTIGVRTKSVGAHVAIGDNGRTPVSAWHGQLKEH